MSSFNVNLELYRLIKSKNLNKLKSYKLLKYITATTRRYEQYNNLLDILFKFYDIRTFLNSVTRAFTVLSNIIKMNVDITMIDNLILLLGSDEHNNILHEAIDNNNNIVIVKLLKYGIDYSIIEKEIFNCIYNVIGFKLLHEYLPEPQNVLNDEGENLLMVSNKNRSLFKYLINYRSSTGGKYDINSVNNNGHDILVLSIICNSPCLDDVLKLRGFKFKDINEHFNKIIGKLPLVYCIENYFFKSFSVLLNSSKINVNEQDENGNTILHNMVINEVSMNYFELLEFNLTIDPYITNNIGEMAKELSDNQDVINILLNLEI